MNNTKRFDGKGEIYAKARPKYAQELLEYIKNTLNIPDGSVFADIGSGTGIFTEQLLDCGYTVYAVEPNNDMRKKADDKLLGRKGYTSVEGTDSRTTLPDSSVDYITAAQAFHWFDSENFKKECKRILKPNGKVMIVYNLYDKEAESNKALEKLRGEFSSEFHGFSGGIGDEACRMFFNNNCDVFRCDNIISYDRQGYIDRLMSSSYSPKENDKRWSEYIDSINDMFDRFQENGAVKIYYHTVAYIGKSGE